MGPVYHPRLKDHEVEYAIKLRHTHERIKSGILVMAGASTLYLKKVMNEDAYKHLLSKADETYREAAKELRHYLEGFEDYKTALNQLRKLLGSADKQKDQKWLVAVADLMSAGTRKIKRATLNLWLDEYITEHGEELEHQAEEMEEEIRLAEAKPHPEGREGPTPHDHHEPHEDHHHEEGHHA